MRNDHFWKLVQWVLGWLLFFAVALPAQEKDKPDKEKPTTPKGVAVRLRASDEEIGERLNQILKATGKYKKTEIKVKDGVVFLEGQAKNERLKQWAAETAAKVEDVVAVFNGIEVAEPSPWDFHPALAELQVIWFDFIRALPFIAFGLATLLLTWLTATIIYRLSQILLKRQISNNLLRQVFGRALALLVLVIGLYLVLQVAGLTRLALTVLGGTGLLGLILGIAFRDITENFLASVFLSVQQPFSTGDLIQIGDALGYVQRMTYRVTLLMLLDGNHLQIPNATVYKSNICNFTSNPNCRQDFVIGIGYENLTTDAQHLALQILADHPAVLKDPEPWVLVDSLGSSSVNLRIYFWVNGHKHSWLKVKSSVIRLVKRAFQDADISLPDESREIVFPEGVPVHRYDRRDRGEDGKKQPSGRPKVKEPESVSTTAEAGLDSEAGKLNEQARQSKVPEGGENLLPFK